MNNKHPFERLLDIQADECFHLFAVIKALFNYPSIHDGSEYPNVDGKLYACAFALICSDYLALFPDFWGNEDFEGFVDDMEFEEDMEYLIAEGLRWGVKYGDDFGNFMFQLLKRVRSKIAQDIKTVFTTDHLQLALFGSIFDMGEELGHSPSSDNLYPTNFLF